MHRRSFLRCSLAGVGAAGLGALLGRQRDWTFQTATRPLPPIHSITPVVGDGHWIWNDPPEETGYLEARDFELEIGIEMEGTGSAQMLKATTPVPINFPEQAVESSEIVTQGCSAVVRSVSNEAAQLFVAAPQIARRQTISAVIKMRLTLCKQYQGFAKDQFPTRQPEPPLVFKRQYLFDSPGIQTRAPQVRSLQKQITSSSTHPWDSAHGIYQWVWENIQGRIGNYTGVLRALKNKVGDCEERAACFVALCRSAGIPARLVWIPNHNWAEFFLVDYDGTGHWIPAHTAAYSWFGWTGAHELVLQKGDNLYVPEKRGPQRLLADWAQWKGARPKLSYTAGIRPQAKSSGEDPGPGTRVKNRQGQWELVQTHQLDGNLRD